jgi:hypothetical protein
MMRRDFWNTGVKSSTTVRSETFRRESDVSVQGDISFVLDGTVVQLTLTAVHLRARAAEDGALPQGTICSPGKIC